MTDEPPVIKRGPGRPPKVIPKVEPKTWNMKAKPNWEEYGATDDEATPDRLRIDRSLFPEGMDLVWVTNSVFGQPMPDRRQVFEKRGWTPVHQTDFDGQFNGMFMKKDDPGEITVDGSVLMARPVEISEKARQVDRRAALNQVRLKEQSWRAGDIGTTLDSRHESALTSNRINRTIERLDIPEK